MSLSRDQYGQANLLFSAVQDVARTSDPFMLDGRGVICPRETEVPERRRPGHRPSPDARSFRVKCRARVALCLLPGLES
jgi:hypothetical protein